ncbi:unnamed protein product [Calicophoron daubneyi]|uniref:Deacetylase sirtuin-type domain-containing protein n=1 Tax=Calicophoron daubneyi TaxID=300641 RepID=A0AAV2TL60_CALDB
MSAFDLEGLKEALDTSADEKEPLESADLKGIAEFIKKGHAKNIITMCGAGISTAAGIPDFRSADSGIYNTLKEFDIPSVEAAMSTKYLKINPKPFFEICRRLYRPDAKPTLGHQFIKLLDDKHLLRRHYTQNVDGLERLTGLDVDKLIEAHGTFSVGHCMKCHKPYDFEYMKERILGKRVPTCSAANCEGVIKPDIVAFGDPLPDRFYGSLQTDFPQCDLLIIMGTSLCVAPFCNLIHLVGKTVPRLYLNHEAPPMGFDSIPWNDPTNRRNVFVSGNIDDAVLKLTDFLGWKSDLVNMKETTDAHLTKSSAQNPATTDSGDSRR